MFDVHLGAGQVMQSGCTSGSKTGELVVLWRKCPDILHITDIYDLYMDGCGLTSATYISKQNPFVSYV